MSYLEVFPPAASGTEPISNCGKLSPFHILRITTGDAK